MTIPDTDFEFFTDSKDVEVITLRPREILSIDWITLDEVEVDSKDVLGAV